VTRAVILLPTLRRRINVSIDSQAHPFYHRSRHPGTELYLKNVASIV
jgi:ribosomal protein L31